MQPRRFRAAIVVCTGVLVWHVPENGLRADETPPELAQTAAGQPAQLRAALDQYCVVCHNSYVSTQATASGVVLDRADLNDPATDPALWERVVRKLKTGEMPPAGMLRPDQPTYDALTGWLEARLDRAALERPNPGRPAVHRLNRAEYTNAIRDLLAMEVDGRSLLPPDDSGYGFDNVADVLSVSPALLERYMIAAGKISRTAIGDPSIRPLIQTYRVRPTLLQLDRTSEQQPFGTRGGLAVRHYFPVDGEYVIKLRLQRTHANQIRGLGEPNDIEIRLDGSRIRTFKVGGDGPRDPWSAVASASVYEQTADEGLELRLPVRAGMHLV